jgi:hypothetical protein
LKSEPAGALVMPGFRTIKEEVRAKQLGEAGNAKDLGTGPSIEKQYQSDEPIELDSVLAWYETRLAELNWRLGQPLNEHTSGEVGRRYRKKIRNWCAGLTLHVSRSLPAPVFLRIRMSSLASASPEKEESCGGRTIPAPQTAEDN